VRYWGWKKNTTQFALSIVRFTAPILLLEAEWPAAVLRARQFRASLRIHMTKIILIASLLLSALLLTGCKGNTDEVWDAFNSKMTANSNMTLTLQDSDVVTRGTVDPGKFTVTASKDRWDAVLIKFKYNAQMTIMGEASDTDETMYVYFIKNPNGRDSLMWRGEDYKEDLYKEMREDGFDGDFPDAHQPDAKPIAAAEPEPVVNNTDEQMRALREAQSRSEEASHQSCKQAGAANIPNIAGMPYENGRSIALATGWDPKAAPESPASSVAQAEWSKRYTEVLDCPASADAVCSFRFMDKVGNILIISTTGEDATNSQAIVSNMETNCSE
jgi:hypothetical protein